MSVRTAFHRGSVFDGSGAGPGPGDVVASDAPVVDVAWDSTPARALTAPATVLPGLFDCHVHVTMTG